MGSASLPGSDATTQRSEVLPRALLAYLFLGVFVTLGLFPADISPFYLVVITGLVAVQFAKQPLFMFRRASVLVLLMIGFIILFDVILLKNLMMAKMVASLALVFVAMNLRLSLLGPMTYRFALLLATAWFAVSVASLLIPKVFAILFYRIGASASRGATGLGPEPAYWGLSSALMVLFFDRFPLRNVSRRQLALIQTLFALSSLLSLSFLAYIYLGLILWHIFGALRTGALLALLVAALLLLFPESLRIVSLIQKVFTVGLYELLLRDKSASDRLSGLVLIIDVLSGKYPPLGMLFSDVAGRALDYNVNGNVLAGLQLISRYGVIGLVMSLTLVGLYLVPFVQQPRGRATLPLFFLVALLVFIGPMAIPHLLLCIARYSEKETI